MRRGIPQDKLGVMIGLDETVASARMSRYETGEHEPPIRTAKAIADALGVPLAYLYCDNDLLADIILAVQGLPADEQQKLLHLILEKIETTKANP